MKMKILLPAILLCLCLCVPAMAELNTAAPLYTYPENTHISMLTSVDMLTVQGDNGIALATLSGDRLTDAIYTNFYEDDGWLEATSAVDTVTVEGVEEPLQAQGILSTDGTVVVPTQYPYVGILNEHWAIACQAEKTEEDKYDLYFIGGESFHANFTQIDVWYLDTATCVATLTPEEYYTAEAEGEYINVMADDETVKGYDKTFTVVAEDLWSVYDFDYASSGETYASDEETPHPESFYDSDSKLYGLQGVDGAVIYPAEFDYVSVYPETGTSFCRFNVKKGDAYLYGLIGVDGTVIIEPEYASVYVSRRYAANGYYDVQLTKDDVKTCGIMDAGGAIVLPIEYDKVCGYGMIGYAVKGDVFTVYTLEAGIVDVGEFNDSDCYINVETNSMTIKYNDDATPIKLIAADGTVTEMADYKYVSYISYGKGNYYTVTDADWNESIVDDHGNVVLAGISGITFNEAGTLLLARDESSNCYALYENK